jgi:predicted HAD superfamily Cof-like phosphohydrolase
MNAALKSKNQLLVELFMAKIGETQPLPVEPTLPSEKTRILRAMLVLEEALEMIREGLGVNVCLKSTINPGVDINFKDLLFDTLEQKPDLVLIADGCADIEVVTLGTMASCGMAQQSIFELVMENNLLKFAPGHGISPEGKLIKPPDHKPPPIKCLLEMQFKEQAY